MTQEIDIAALRKKAQEAEYAIAISPAVILALLDRLEQAEKDAARLDWLEKQMGSNLVNDNAGRWAISDSGMQPGAPEGGFTETTSNHCIVFPENWRPSIRDAISAAMRKEG